MGVAYYSHNLVFWTLHYFFSAKKTEICKLKEHNWIMNCWGFVYNLKIESAFYDGKWKRPLPLLRSKRWLLYSEEIRLQSNMILRTIKTNIKSHYFNNTNKILFQLRLQFFLSFLNFLCHIVLFTLILWTRDCFWGSKMGFVDRGLLALPPHYMCAWSEKTSRDRTVYVGTFLLHPACALHFVETT